MILTLAQIKDGTGFEPDARFEPVTDYNGWANRETWAVALWINNDEGMQETVHENLRGWAEQRSPGVAISALTLGADAHEAGDQVVREFIGELFDWSQYADGGHPAVVPQSLLNMREDIGSLWRVDWDELGAAFLRDVAEDDAYNS